MSVSKNEGQNVSKVIIKCPECGEVLENTGFAEMVVSDPLTGKVLPPV